MAEEEEEPRRHMLRRERPYDFELLRRAIRTGNLEAVKEVGSSAEPIAYAGWRGLELLDCAAGRGEVAIMAYLVEELGCPTMPDKSDSSQESPLHTAAAARQLEAVQYLVEQCGVDPLSEDIDDHSAVLKALEEGSENVFFYFMDEGVDADAAGSRDRLRPIHYCSDKPPLLRYLVQEKGVDVNAVDKDGMTVLHFAAMEGCMDSVRFLVDETSVDVLLLQKNHLSACGLAEKEGHKDIVAFLREAEEMAQMQKQA